MRKTKVIRYSIMGLMMGGLSMYYSDQLRILKERVYEQISMFLLPLPEEIRRKRHIDHYHRFGRQYISPFRTLDIQTDHFLRSLSSTNILPTLKKQDCTLEGYFQALEDLTHLDFRLDPTLATRNIEPYDEWWKAENGSHLYLRDSVEIIFSTFDLHTDPVGYGKDRWIDVWSTQNL